MTSLNDQDTIDRQVLILDETPDGASELIRICKQNSEMVLSPVGALAMMWGSGLLRLRRRSNEPPRPATKCGLPSCHVLSARDYCCAEHCKEHRRIHGTQRK